MQNYSHIESEARWAEPAQLKSGKFFREKYYRGYGGNQINYRICKRGSMWEARVDWGHYWNSSSYNYEVKDEDLLHVSRKLKDMNDWLGSLKPHKKAQQKINTE